MCTSPLSAGGGGGEGGLNLLPNFQKGRGAWQDLNFEKEVAGKDGCDVFQGEGWNFYIKNNLKSEIFNDKKSL